jgi:hypothetical protein
MKETAKPERKDFYFKAIDGLPEFDFYKYMDKVEEYVSKLQAKHEEELIRLNDLLMASRSIYKEGSEPDQRWEASLAKHTTPNTKEL